MADAADDVPTIMNHISLGTNDFEKAIVFYDAVLGTLGAKRLFSHEDAAEIGRAHV